MKDSGKRKKFSTGAVRDRVQGKGRFDLISPIALRRVASIYEKGEVKYKDGRNWERGMPLGEYLDSALRHINQHREGLRDEDHIGQAAWNLLAFIHTEEQIKRGMLPKELNNIPSYLPRASSKKQK